MWFGATRDPRAIIRLADANSMLDQPQRVREELQQALALAPDAADSMFQAGAIWERPRDRKPALERIAKAIKGGYSRDLIEKGAQLTAVAPRPKVSEFVGPLISRCTSSKKEKHNVKRIRNKNGCCPITYARAAYQTKPGSLE